jgi:hypothetical protein
MSGSNYTPYNGYQWGISTDLPMAKVPWISRGRIPVAGIVGGNRALLLLGEHVVIEHQDVEIGSHETAVGVLRRLTIGSPRTLNDVDDQRAAGQPIECLMMS